MNLNKALKLIKEIENNVNNIKSIVNLKEMIVEAIKLEKVTETTTKTRYNRARRVLKRSEKKREILTRVLEENNKQYFTDAYVLFELKDIIPELPQLDEGMIYPKVKEIIDNTKSRNTKEIKVNCKDLKQLIRISNKYIELEIEGGLKVGFESNLLLDILIILEYRNKDEVTIKYNPENKRDGYLVTPLLLEHNENTAVLMPVMTASSYRLDVSRVNINSI